MTLCLFIWMTKSFQNGVYFYRKNLVLRSKFPSIKELTSIEKGSKTENELFPLKMYFYCLKIKVTDLEMLSFDQSFLKVNNFSMPGWK